MEMLHRSDRSALVLVDMQTRLVPHIDQGAVVLAQAVRLARIAKLLGVPVVGTEQYPEGLGQLDAQVRTLCDEVLIKNHFDACEDGLERCLSDTCRHVVVAGTEAHVCVLQTCVGLLDRDFQVTLVVDAVGSRLESSRVAAIQRMAGLASAGLMLATVEMVAFEWMRTGQHSKFRDVLALIK